MTAYNWRTDFPGAGAAELLVGQLARIQALVDAGDRDAAMRETFGRRWASNLDLTGVPVEVLKKAQHHVDAAYDALQEGDPARARLALKRARQVVRG